MAKKNLLSGKDNTNGFQKNPQNINRKGRPRKLVSSVLAELKEKGLETVSVAQIKELYLTFLNLTIKEQTEITKDEKQPAINRIVCKALLSNKGFEAVKDILDRAMKIDTADRSHNGWGSCFQIVFQDGTKTD